MMHRRQTLQALMAAGLPLVWPARASGFPEKPIKIVVSSVAGGSPDSATRQIVAAMADDLKQPFVVENRVGGNGSIGIDTVARSQPDGYTLLVSPMSSVTTNQHLYAKLPQNPLDALIGVNRLVSGYFYLAVRSSLDFKTLPELIRYAKAHPGKLTAAVPALGSIPHLGMVQFGRSAGIDMLLVPFASTTAAVMSTASGETDIVIETMAPLRVHIQSGRLRTIAISTATRHERSPDVPTFAEAGVPKMEMAGWIGLFAPVETSREIVETLSRSAHRVLQRPALRESLELIGLPADGLRTVAFNTEWRSESERWGEIVRSANVKME